MKKNSDHFQRQSKSPFTRRQFLKDTVLSTLAFTTPGLLLARSQKSWQPTNINSATMQGQKSSTRPPNIIFLLTDDQRWDTLGCYGNNIIHTPHIDSLAKRGITFDRAFVTSSICAPNRSCILTGQYAARHKMWKFDRELTPNQLAATYPALLKSTAGYRTGLIGKYGVGKPPGKDVFDFNKGFSGQGKFLFEKNGKQVHLTSVMADQAEEFIVSSDGSQPFHLSISFKAPHVQDNASVKSNQFPYDPDPAIADLYEDIEIPVPATATQDYFDRWPAFIKNSEARSRWAVRYFSPERTQESLKGYYRLISGVDAAVGRIVAALEKHGFADNTIIIFSSDNGQYLGDYGFAGKWYPHEASIRVPLIVYDPRLSKDRRGARTNDFALSIDIGPTILDLAGVDVPDVMQGQSLVPLIQGQIPHDWRQEVYYEHHFVPDPAWHMSIPRNEGIRTARWKYIQYIDSDPLFEELYDLDSDPLEKQNLATDPEQTNQIRKFREKLLIMRKSVE
ncbi:sulfatase [candidate division KSB1 bacterium]|nr:sulfatase [candidate division KSB1 bacterium]